MNNSSNPLLMINQAIPGIIAGHDPFSHRVCRQAKKIAFQIEF